MTATTNHRGTERRTRPPSGSNGGAVRVEESRSHRNAKSDRCLTGSRPTPTLLRMCPDSVVRLACVSCAAILLTTACHHTPLVRFAPNGTDAAILRSNYPLTAEERQRLTPGNVKELTQAQIDQIYLRLSTGPMPDGPFRGDLFFPRGSHRGERVRDLNVALPPQLDSLAAMPIEHLGRALWKGKVFFRAEGILRNRIDDLAILKPLIPDSSTIPRLTFDGQTTWLLFPAKTSCGASLLEPAQHAIIIDYSKGPEVQGYRDNPDRLAGKDALDIHDEVRLVRPGFYIGRAYFRGQFRLNFTLVDPAKMQPGGDVAADCQ